MPGNIKPRYRQTSWLWTIAAICIAFLAQIWPGAVWSPAKAAESVAKDTRLGGDARRTRFVTVLSKKVQFAIRTLPDPYRVIIDLSDVKLDLPAGRGEKGRGLVSGYRYGRVEPYGVRIILDVKSPVLVEKASIWPARAGNPPRLVVELVKTDRKTFLAKQRTRAKSRTAANKTGRKAARGKPALRSPQRRKARSAKPVIVIDPGHGGIDPGTVAKSGIKEKNVVFAFSRMLRDILKKTGRYEVILTRDTDSYVPLRQRVDIGRHKGADLFISVHADSIPGRQARSVTGATVYTLSEDASDDEAKALAAKENRSDIIAGVELPAQSNDLTNILIDLAQRETKNLSIGFADILVSSLSGKTKMRKKARKFAGFRVLKAPDVPSVLVELGYLSNPSDAKRLNSSAWRSKVAAAAAKAVGIYFSKRTARNPF